MQKFASLKKHSISFLRTCPVEATNAEHDVLSIVFTYQWKLFTDEVDKFVISDVRFVQ